MDMTSVSFSLYLCSLFPSSTVDAVNGGTARGVGLTDGARKQREYSNYSSQYSEMLQPVENIRCDKISHIKKHN